LGTDPYRHCFSDAGNGDSSGTAAKQSTEKLHPGASGAKALTETKGFIAALKTLRHPKSEFFSKL
jgi:hypothetical protein